MRGPLNSMVIGTFNNKSLDEIIELTDQVKAVVSEPRKHKSGRYRVDGEYFDSLPELALWVYAKDHNEEIEHESVSLFYFIDDKLHRYFPDFKYNNKLVEIKGNHLVDNEGNLLPFYSNDKDSINRCNAKTLLMNVNDVEVWTEDKYSYYVDWFNQHYNKDDFLSKDKYVKLKINDFDFMGLINDILSSYDDYDLAFEKFNIDEDSLNSYIQKLLEFTSNYNDAISYESILNLDHASEEEILDYYSNHNVKSTTKKFNITYTELKTICKVHNFVKTPEQIKDTYKTTREEKYGSLEGYRKSKKEALKNTINEKYSNDNLYNWIKGENKSNNKKA